MKKNKNRLSKIERSVHDKQNISDNTITIESIIEKLGLIPEKTTMTGGKNWMVILATIVSPTLSAY